MALARKSGSVAVAGPNFSYPYPEGHSWGMVLDQLRKRLPALPHVVDDWIGRARVSHPHPYCGIWHGTGRPERHPPRLVRVVSFGEVEDGGVPYPAVLTGTEELWRPEVDRPAGGARMISVGGETWKDLTAFPGIPHLLQTPTAASHLPESVRVVIPRRLPIPILHWESLVAWFDPKADFAYDLALVLAMRHAMPILANRHPRAVQYLGDDYPLFLASPPSSSFPVQDLVDAPDYLRHRRQRMTCASLVDALLLPCNAGGA